MLVQSTLMRRVLCCMSHDDTERADVRWSWCELFRVCDARCIRQGLARVRRSDGAAVLALTLAMDSFLMFWKSPERA